MITVTCPKCASAYRLPPNMAGRSVACSKCKAVFPAPAANSTEPLDVIPVTEPPAALTAAPPRPGVKPAILPTMPPPNVRKPAGKSPALLVAGLVAAVLGGFLLLVCGGLGLIFFLSSGSKPPVAQRNPVTVQPGGQLPNPPAQPPVVFNPPEDVPIIRPAPPPIQPDEPRTPPKRELAALALPKAQAGAETFQGTTTNKDDLRITASSLKALPCLHWTADGKEFYALNGDNGKVARVALDGFREQRVLNIGRRCGWLAVSAAGVLVTVTDLQEVWVLDPATLEVKARIAAPMTQRIASAPGLWVAFSGGGNQLDVLDLKQNQHVAILAGRYPVGYERPICAPDGKYLFTMGGMEKLHRFRIDGTKLKYEESSQRIAQGHIEAGICVSPDSKYVCLPSGGGNYGNLPDHPPSHSYSTYVYPVDNINRPAFTLPSGAYPNAVGFDPAAKLVYAHNHDKQLIVYTDTGVQKKDYFWTRGTRLRQFLVHPAGRKVLLFLDDKLFQVDVPAG